jgi:hypothetical protein
LPDYQCTTISHADHPLAHLPDVVSGHPLDDTGRRWVGSQFSHMNRSGHLFLVALEGKVPNTPNTTPNQAD